MIQRNVTHRIRLRKPWQREDHAERSGDEQFVSADGDGLVVASRRVDVPDPESIQSKAESAGANGVRRVIYRRQFHRPSGLESGDRVLLEVGIARGRLVAIRLNALTISVGCDGDVGCEGNTNVGVIGTSDTVAGCPETGQLPVRLRLDERLADHNELEIELESTPDIAGPPRLIGEVNLLIVACE